MCQPYICTNLRLLVNLQIGRVRRAQLTRDPVGFCLLMLRIDRCRCTLYILKFDLSTDPWESGDGLEVRASGAIFLAKNQPNRLRNTHTAGFMPEAEGLAVPRDPRNILYRGKFRKYFRAYNIRNLVHLHIGLILICIVDG